MLLCPWSQAAQPGVEQPGASGPSYGVAQVQVLTCCRGRGGLGRAVLTACTPVLRVCPSHPTLSPRAACRVRAPHSPLWFTSPFHSPLTLLVSSLWLASVGAWPPGRALVASLLPTALPRGPLPFLSPLPGMPLLSLLAWPLLQSFPSWEAVPALHSRCLSLPGVSTQLSACIQPCFSPLATCPPP